MNCIVISEALCWLRYIKSLGKSPISILLIESGINFRVLMEPCSINLNLIFSNENHSKINIFFFLLVSKLRNDKQCLVKSFLALINVEQGAHDLQGVSHEHIKKNKKNKHLS